MYDITIIGAGVAGMTAALYAARSGLSVLLLEAAACGGQITEAAEIENYPAINHISGWELASALEKQIGAQKNIKFIRQSVVSLSLEEKIKKVMTEKENFSSKAVIISNGAKRRKLNCPGEQEFPGRGVSYCAVCDGGFFRGKVVAVIGGGNTALEDALYLSKLCKKVYIVHRRDIYRAQRAYIEAVKQHSNIVSIWNSHVSEIHGTTQVSELVITDLSGIHQKTLPVDGVFIAVGFMPENQLFAGTLALDKNGYILANEDCKTNLPGVYAAGDTRQKPLRQIITAASDGAIAATMAAEYITTQQ